MKHQYCQLECDMSQLDGNKSSITGFSWKSQGHDIPLMLKLCFCSQIAQYLTHFYDRALEYLGGYHRREYAVTHAYMWSIGSYDIMGANPWSNCKVESIAKKVRSHNRNVMREATYIRKFPNSSADLAGLYKAPSNCKQMISPNKYISYSWAATKLVKITSIGMEGCGKLHKSRLLKIFIAETYI